VTGLREQQKAATREAILDAAARAFADHGFEGTTFSTIAAEMGRPKSAVGHHQFATKAKIAAAVVAEQLEDWGRIVRDAEFAPAGLVRLLTIMTVAAQQVRVEARARATIRLVMEREHIKPELPLNGSFTWSELAEGEIGRAVADGVLPAGTDPAEVGRRLISASFGVYALENSGFQAVDTVRNLQVIWLDMLRALGARDPEFILDEAARAAKHF